MSSAIYVMLQVYHTIFFPVIKPIHILSIFYFSTCTLFIKVVFNGVTQYVLIRRRKQYLKWSEITLVT